jgi:hypothetical protein
MELKSCRVTVRDLDGVAHTVEVTASALYEPVLPWLEEVGQPPVRTKRETLLSNCVSDLYSPEA